MRKALYWGLKYCSYRGAFYMYDGAGVNGRKNCFSGKRRKKVLSLFFQK